MPGSLCGALTYPSATVFPAPSGMTQADYDAELQRLQSALAETGKPPRRVQLDAYDTDRFRPKYSDREGDPLLLTPSLGPALD